MGLELIGAAAYLQFCNFAHLQLCHKADEPEGRCKITSHTPNNSGFSKMYRLGFLACKPNPSRAQTSNTHSGHSQAEKVTVNRWLSLRAPSELSDQPPPSREKGPMRLSGSPMVVSTVIFSLATSNQSNYLPYQM